MVGMILRTDPFPKRRPPLSVARGARQEMACDKWRPIRWPGSCYSWGRGRVGGLRGRVMGRVTGGE